MEYKNPVTQELMTKENYMNFMFGEEFMKSDDKGTLKKYELIEKVKNSYLIKEMWLESEIENIPNLSLKDLKEICEEIDENNNDNQ